MRRVVLLMLMTFACSTAMLANEIVFSTGAFEQGTITSFGANFSVQVVGSSDTITLDIPDLVCSATRCYFSSGTVTVVNPVGVTVFTDSLYRSFLSRTATTALIFAYIEPDPLGSGGSIQFSVKFSGHTILAGDAEALPVPEPSTPEGLLLGTGAVIGVTGMARRKLIHGT